MLTPLTIVTAADSSFFVPLQNLLWTVAQCEPQSKLVVWDLGMTPSQLAALKAAYPTLDIRTFDFSKYPAYFSPKTNSGRDAFRPASLSLAATEFGGLILWLDATSIIQGPLLKMRAILKKNGLYAKAQTGACGKYLYPSSATALNATVEDRAQPLRNPGVFGMDSGNPAVKDLMTRWTAANLNPAVTNPDGFNRKGKHFSNESAIFTVLLHQSKNPIEMDDSNILIQARQYGMTRLDVQFRRGFKDVAAYRKWRDAK